MIIITAMIISAASDLVFACSVPASLVIFYYFYAQGHFGSPSCNSALKMVSESFPG